MNEEERAVQLLQGRVKWFDPAKGFGFIVCDDIPQDILLHANVLRNYGQGSVADGARIVVKAHETPRGIQAFEVVSIEPPVPVHDEVAVEDQPDLSDLPLEPARVKWFDKGKGFGFANVFGRPEDVFIHIEILRQSGLADLQSGEAVALRIAEGKRGRMAVQVVAWESAARRRD